MATSEVDDYIARLEEPQRSTLQQLRETIRSIIPEAEERISYGMPGFRLRGRMVAGFAAFSNHLSYFPHSGSVLGRLKSELAGYSGTKSGLHFPIDQPLPPALVEKLIAVRLSEIDATAPREGPAG